MSCFKYLTLISCLILGYSIHAKTYSITDFGAKSDTTVLSTIAIQKTIDVCSDNGGGTVVVPAGHYKTGTIQLQNNVNLFLETGAILFGSTNLDDYIDMKPGFVSLRTQEATKQLIYAENKSNVSITGHGEIDGQGVSFKKMSWNDEGITRPHLIRFICCNNIRVEGISLRNSACWMQHYLACNKVQIKSLRIFNRNNFNNDALDLDGCKDVTVSDIISDSDDDGITLKSTSDRMCENIAITNCVVSSRCNAIKMGTESNGGFRNITISNIVVQPSDYKETEFYGSIHGTSGITLEIVDGGTMENITIDNINIEETESPIFIRLANRARPYKKGMTIDHIGTITDVMISNVHIKNAQNIGCSITGQPNHPVQNVTLNNIVYHHYGGGTSANASKKIEDLPEQYPEATMFGILPAQGIYIRHAKNVQIKNLEVRTINGDYRPVIYADDISGCIFKSIKKEYQVKTKSAFEFKNSTGIIEVNNCQIIGELEYFAGVNDNNAIKILITNNQAGNLKNWINNGTSENKSVISQNNFIINNFTE